MQETGSSKTTGISVQISKNGYIVRLLPQTLSSPSSWMGSECFFTAPEFRKRYDVVRLSLFTPKFALVPEQFFSEGNARRLLSETAEIRDTDVVAHVLVPSQNAVLVYSCSMDETFSKVVSDTVLRTDGTPAKVYPEIFYMLDALHGLEDYNKVVASYADGRIYIVVAQGRSLCLCNSFEAADFVTAEYFIFHVLKRLQLNPEVTVIYFRTPLAEDEEMSLYKYFKAVDYI